VVNNFDWPISTKTQRQSVLFIPSQIPQLTATVKPMHDASCQALTFLLDAFVQAEGGLSTITTRETAKGKMPTSTLDYR
jgi:hypothetical protein